TKLCSLEPRERNTRDVAAYVTDFRTLVTKIPGLSDKDKEIRFTSGLPNWLYSRLATAETPPTSYDTWEQRALKAYAAAQRVKEREQADRKGPSSSSTTTTTKTTTTQTSRPTFTPAPRASNAGPVPMDVDASRVPRQIRPGTKCFRCNKVTNPPHMARDCTDPNPLPRQPRAAATVSATTSSNASAAAATTNHEETIANLMDTIETMRKELEALKTEKEGF
ncbi:hypothetical protein BDW22DRAFT_1436196, partial [Trametopsis cervina]